MDVKIKENSWVGRLAARKLGAKNVAIVFGHTIHLFNVSKEEFLCHPKWVKHELCHVKQFEKHGFYTFLFKYLWESIVRGYRNNKYEIEARQAEDD